jgi:hypothetical protein
VFGMGTGVTLAVIPPELVVVVSDELERTCKDDASQLNRLGINFGHLRQIRVKWALTAGSPSCAR